MDTINKKIVQLTLINEWEKNSFVLSIKKKKKKPFEVKVHTYCTLFDNS